LPAPWRRSALRLPAALALGTAIVATVAISDAPSRDELSGARAPSARDAGQAAATPSAAAPARTAVTPVAGSPAASPSPPPTDAPDGPARQPATPPWVPAADSTRRPEGAAASLQPSEADGYLPTQARLISPSGRYTPVNADVRIGFNLPIRNRAAFEQAFQVEPSVAGRLDWADSRTIRFRPQKLAYGTTYRVRVAALAGRPETGEGWGWTFTTMRRATFTFDDCPTSPAAAQDLLAFLRQRHIKAMTFPTGQCSRQYPWLVPALLADGHQVCNHTWSHADLPKLTDAQISAEIAGGVHAGCNLLRPPYGDWDGPGGRVERAATQQGYRLQFWDVDTLDWTGLSGPAIVSRIYDGGGGVVLMHFHGRHTLEALKLMDIPALTGQP
jgi:peptidoglycan/xylan/chitin deacetylase (PgdA/CDA1 family)